jgi:hypothetical protein
VHQVRGEQTGKCFALAFDDAVQMSGDTPAARAQTQMSFFVDASGFQLFLNLDLRPLLQMAKASDNYFAERVYKVYVIDMPSIAAFVANAVLPLLPPKTRTKVNFVRSADLPGHYDVLDLDGPTRGMLGELLRMNRAATPQTGRDESLAFTKKFLIDQGNRRYVP